MIDPHEYSITVKKVLVDGEPLFKAIIKELPDVVEYGQTYDEAYGLAIDTISTAAMMCAESNTPFPQPLGQKQVCYA